MFITLQVPSSYDFSQYSEQSYRKGRGRPDPLDVVKTMPKQSNEGILILSTVHPQKVSCIDR